MNGGSFGWLVPPKLPRSTGFSSCAADVCERGQAAVQNALQMGGHTQLNKADWVTFSSSLRHECRFF